MMTTIKFDNLQLKSNFRRYGHTVVYPIKTNSTEPLLRELKPLLDGGWNGFAVTDKSEFDKLTTIGVAVNRIAQMNPLASDKENMDFYAFGMRNFTFDNIKSLAAFLQYANPRECQVNVRLNVNEVFKDATSHLGASASECAKMCKILSDAKYPNFGISFYLQQEIDKNFGFADMLAFINKKIPNKGTTLTVAGACVTPEHVEKCRAQIGEKRVIFEAGRGLVGNTMDMWTNVVRHNKIGANNIVVMNGGIYAGLADEKIYPYGRKYNFKLEADGEFADIERLGENAKSDENKYVFKLFGSSMDSGDDFGKCGVARKKKPMLCAGANLIVKNIGAYCLTPLGTDMNFEIVSK